MRLQWWLGCVLATIPWAPALHARQPSPNDIYAHFVGTWAGTDRYLEGTQYRTKPLTLEITELPKGKGIALEFRYGDGGQYPFEKPVRKVMRLDPAHETMTAQKRLLETMEFQTAGLAEFAKSGLGDFGVRLVQLEHGVVVAYVGQYHLSPDELSWHWDRAEKDQSFVPYGNFQLHRSPASPH